ncbi:MAG: heme-binding protein [Woeseiaceae bacterium]|nr:heme-binding protein [Woeseiaceae bacterium]
MKRLLLLALLAISPGATMALEEPRYEVLLKKGDIEFRRYEPYIVAEVTVSGDREAFGVLAGYIFGDNVEEQKMNMTAPVETRDRSYAFVMESKYSMDSLPTPNDDRIRLKQRPSRIVAVRGFSGRWSDRNFARHERALLEELAAQGIETRGAAEIARYNSPFTPWFLRRNEIIVPVNWLSVDVVQNVTQRIATEAAARL